MGARLFVGGLPWSVDDDKLRRLVEQRGFQVIDAKVITDRETGRSRGFGFATLADGVDAAAAIQALDGATVEGRSLRVNLAEDRGGTRRQAAPDRGRAPAPRSPPGALAAADGRFVHPYNFVSVPQDGLGLAANFAPFRREASAGHDRYDAHRHTGHVECVLTTRSWWFIPDPRKRDPHKPRPGDHLTAGYATLDSVQAWDPESADADRTRPFVPAASLRGMVRSVFEAATLSCLSVFDPGGLDFRIGFDPGFVRPGSSGSKAHRPDYIPVRVLGVRQDGGVEVHVLDGRRSGDPGNTLPVALVHAYTPRVVYKERGRDQVGSSTPLWSSHAALADGAAVAALIDNRPRPHSSNRYHFREVQDLVTADQAANLRPSSGQWLVFGYLHRTGPNIERKHHERVFFRAGAPYNDPASRLPIPQRLDAFQKDRTPTLVAPAEVVREAQASLRGYAERHDKELRRVAASPRPIGAGAPFPSDFVGEHTVATGSLLYAIVSGGSCVRGLYPVALPRLAHEDDRGALLHRDFHSCEEPADLCAACRVFGWVRPVLPGTRLPELADRVDAVAGHVRFGHGILEGDWGSGSRQARRTTLAILGSPKPTTTAFYLEKRDGFDAARATRWPPVLQNEKAIPRHVPLYRTEEAALRGRKFYRHRETVNPASDDQRANGLCRAPGDDGRPKADDQNQTVHLLPPALEFRFRIDFDNLSQEELGALLFALTLQAPEAWGSPQLRHALGRGKPLGMGACDIRVEALCLDVHDPQNPDHRYARVPIFGEDLAAPEATKPDILRHLRTFGDTWTQLDSDPALRKTREQLVEMLRADPPDGSVHYPLNLRGEPDKNFEWFVANKKGGHVLPDPVSERAQPESRLPLRPEGARSDGPRGSGSPRSRR